MKKPKFDWQPSQGFSKFREFDEFFHFITMSTRDARAAAREVRADAREAEREAERAAARAAYCEAIRDRCEKFGTKVKLENAYKESLVWTRKGSDGEWESIE